MRQSAGLTELVTEAALGVVALAGIFELVRQSTGLTDFTNEVTDTREYMIGLTDDLACLSELMLTSNSATTIELYA